MTQTARRPFRYIDAHAHMSGGSDGAALLLTAMDQLGIEKTVVVAGGTVSPQTLSLHFVRAGSVDVDADNDGVLAACDTAHGRLLPFFFANPLKGAGAYRKSARRFYGLKLAPIVHGVPFADARMHDLIGTAADLRHPVYLHCLPREGFGVADLVTLAAEHPTASIIMGHGGVGQADFHGIELVAPQPNIFFEASGAFSGTTRVAWKTLGADRVMFGSEYPLQDQRVELEKLRCLNLPAGDYTKIMRDNILRLLGDVPVTTAENVRAGVSSVGRCLLGMV